MVLIVEDGSGLTDADSYVSVETATLYLGKYGYSSWTGPDLELQEAALRRGTRYLDSFYGSRWIGDRSNEEQSLDWPRKNISFVGSDIIPGAIIAATIEASWRELLSPHSLLPDVPQQDLKSLTVGPISLHFSDPGATLFVDGIGIINNLVSRFIEPETLMRWLKRA